MRKSAKVEVRCTSEEKERWRETAGPTPISEWIRALANAATAVETVRTETHVVPAAYARPEELAEHVAREAALEKESQAKDGPPAEVAVPPPVTARPRVTPSRAPIERKPFRPDFK